MLNLDKAALIVEALGTDAIADLQEKIATALADSDDAEAMRLDRLLQEVEAILNVDAYPGVASPVCLFDLFPDQTTVSN